MKFLLLGLGIALSIEGGFYFLFADRVKDWFSKLQELPESYLRWGGFAALIIGMLMTLLGYSMFEL